LTRRGKRVGVSVQETCNLKLETCNIRRPMTTEEFETLVMEAVKELPEFFRRKMENVVVLTAEAPKPAQERKFGKNLLGLYEGIPISQRGAYYSGAMPDKITIFKKNIEAACPGEKEIKTEVKHVVMHEIAHHFGMDDDELKEKGLY